MAMSDLDLSDVIIIMNVRIEQKNVKNRRTKIV